MKGSLGVVPWQFSFQSRTWATKYLKSIVLLKVFGNNMHRRPWETLTPAKVHRLCANLAVANDASSFFWKVLRFRGVLGNEGLETLSPQSLWNPRTAENVPVLQVSSESVKTLLHRIKWVPQPTLGLQTAMSAKWWLSCVCFSFEPDFPKCPLFQLKNFFSF